MQVCCALAFFDCFFRLAGKEHDTDCGTATLMCLCRCADDDDDGGGGLFAPTKRAISPTPKSSFCWTPGSFPEESTECAASFAFHHSLFSLPLSSSTTGQYYWLLIATTAALSLDCHITIPQLYHFPFFCFQKVSLSFCVSE